MCRMYNDYGSTGRDAAEGNLNSINFPEYDSTPGGTEAKKRALFEIADYERNCLTRALQRLGAVSRDTGDASLDQMQNRQMEIWQMFCDVTDLYGQIYVVRDIGSRVTGPISGPKA
ncbi:aphidicolan-16beta-ol synthase [Apiospora kogelbergensis]|uniref:aphidicolan-16beta-ol synthase n=1 Tax=Apiospora kogelbergensis TaxID=1337665 RepID=UPI00312E8583